METAIKSSNVNEVIKVANKNPDAVSTPINQDLTPLGLAAYRGFAEIVAELLSRGADPNERFHPPGQFGACTPLEIAERRKFSDVIDVFRKYVNVPSEKKGTKTKNKNNNDWPKVEGASERNSDNESHRCGSLSDTDTDITEGVFSRQRQIEIGGNRCAGETDSDSDSEHNSRTSRSESLKLKRDKELIEMGRMYTKVLAENEELAANLALAEAEGEHTMETITRLTTRVNTISEEKDKLFQKSMALESKVAILRLELRQMREIQKENAKLKRELVTMSCTDNTTATGSSDAGVSMSRQVTQSTQTGGDSTSDSTLNDPVLIQGSDEGKESHEDEDEERSHVTYAETNTDTNADNTTDEEEAVEMDALKRMLRIAQEDNERLRRNVFDEMIELLKAQRDSKA